MAHLTSAFKSTQIYSSRQSSIKGSQNGLQMPKCKAVVVMRKKEIHPEWFDESKVTCNGEEVLVTSGTRPSYTVDVWSGNHPYYQGITSSVVTDEGRVNRFKRRFGGLDSLSQIETAADALERAKNERE